ncbi:MAG TPA: hypothetical protein VG388_00640 [Solirubrobacteraceae bacterium]|nr:hypothetical protein [Solirubrobacteraceae bacterium]
MQLGEPGTVCGPVGNSFERMMSSREATRTRRPSTSIIATFSTNWS